MGLRRDLQTGVLFKRGLGVSERSELTPCIYMLSTDSFAPMVTPCSIELAWSHTGLSSYSSDPTHTGLSSYSSDPIPDCGVGHVHSLIAS